jgi:hypothetical protein
LCLQGHNDVSTLERRHIRRIGDKFELVLFRENDPEELAIYLDALLTVITDCSMRVHQLVGSERTEHYKTRMKETTAFRDAEL